MLQAQDVREVRVNENHLLCPINQTIMDDPVIAMDGRTYDRAAIATWQAHNGTSPITREPITNVFITNYTVKGLIDEYNAAMNIQNVAEAEIGHTVAEPQPCLYADWLSKLGQSLSIPNKELWYGSVVEQTLVALADIHTSQVGASFDKEGNGVCFLLNFSNTAEHQRFVLHYRNKYAGSILQQGEYQTKASTKVVLDTKTLYETITKVLGEFRREHSLGNIMTSLAKSLNVDFKEVYIGGDAVERRLVAKAGISTSQKEACYGTIGYRTAFHLAFANRQEHELFLNYYNENYPNFIINHDAYNESGLTKIEVSSRLLLSKIAPALDNNLDQANKGCVII